MPEKSENEEKLYHEKANIADMKIVSSLEKVFPYEKATLFIDSASMLKDERLHFQIVVKSDEHVMDGEIRVEGALAPYVSIFSEDYVAVTSEISRWPAYDDYRIRNEREMGIYPDILRPFDKYKHVFKKNVYTPFWVRVDTRGEMPAGKYEVSFTAYNERGESLGHTSFIVEIIDETLSDEKPYVLDWIHFDSICFAHNTKFLSKKFYKYLNEYLRLAVQNGMNVLLTPALSFAVDADVGTYRKDVQLLKITENENGYAFDFSDLEYFMQNARDCGITHFCFSHIASQWGAKSAVRVRVMKNGVKQYKFGWKQASTNEEYVAFLSEYLRALNEFLQSKGWLKNSFISISDETGMKGSENYVRLSEIIRRNTSLKILDTTGEDFYIDNDLMDVPVVSADKYDELKTKKNCWVYYCCAQRSKYISNRFINMPSQRNRVLGIQMYANGVNGFLHWGYNFYAGYLSRQFASAYGSNDGMGMFEAGDCFMVYPTQKGCIESIRQPVFYDGLQDFRALKTLEKYIGRTAVLELLKREGVQGFTRYPRSAVWHIAFREKINRMIAESVRKEK